MTLLLTATGTVLLVLCWFGWQLLRQNGRILLRLDDLEKRLDELEFGEREAPEGLPIGSEAPAFKLPDLAGERRSLEQFRGRPVLMVFFHPDCGFCREMMPKLATLRPHPVLLQEARSSGRESAPSNTPPRQSRLTSAATIQEGDEQQHPRLLLITTGDVEKNRQFFAEHKIACPVLLQKDGEVAKAYQARGTPSGYLISPEGKIASSLAMGAEALLALAAQPYPLTPALSPSDGERENAAGNGDGRASRFGNRSLAGSKIKRDGLKAGTPAPDFRLPRLDGRGDLTLSELRGKRVLLVFSSPGCCPCNALAPELESFHRQHPELEVLMISKGEPKENRAKVKEHRLTFPIVLQQQWEISRRYAMFATPVAYLIDEAGVIIHDVAVGVDQIQALLSTAADSAAQSPEPSFGLNSAVET